MQNNMFLVVLLGKNALPKVMLMLVIQHQARLPCQLGNCFGNVHADTH